MKGNSYRVIFFLLFLLLSFSVFPQSFAPPRGFAGIEIGMSFDQVDQLLRSSGFFYYRGPDDVSFSPGRERRVMEVEGGQYISRGILQFIEERLFSLTLVLNQDMVDHYTIYTTLTERYGEPVEFNPQRIVWSDSQVRLTLERPLTIQYLDEPLFNRIREQSNAGESLKEVSRQMFLEQF
ncbi:MAG: hypothetical protein D6B26_06910 [Spirochaetaceae bacterium]|nr:MAG: hypothetical protein D6B26_06910 [Spirochaetaceae bacterium]